MANMIGEWLTLNGGDESAATKEVYSCIKSTMHNVMVPMFNWCDQDAHHLATEHLSKDWISGAASVTEMFVKFCDSLSSTTKTYSAKLDEWEAITLAEKDRRQPGTLWKELMAEWGFTTKTDIYMYVGEVAKVMSLASKVGLQGAEESTSQKKQAALVAASRALTDILTRPSPDLSLLGGGEDFKSEVMKQAANCSEKFKSNISDVYVDAVRVWVRSLVIKRFPDFFAASTLLPLDASPGRPHIYIYIYIYVYTCVFIMYVHIHICIYICTRRNVYACTYVRIYTCMYICVHACMPRVHVYVCMYV